MSFHWSVYACLILGLWCTLVGGAFKAFSEFIMAALLSVRPEGGIEAMQQINRRVLATEFVFSLIALAPLSLAFAIYGWFALDGLASVLVVAAAWIYLPAVFLVTLLGNVPMNERLAGFAPASGEAASYWFVYGRAWTRLNHVRAVGSVVTSAFYLMALLALVSVQ